MGRSKIIYAGNTLIDLTADTVSAIDLVEGITAHGADGEKITGTNPYAKDQTDAVVDAQADLIEQIAQAVNNLPNASGVGGAVETCAVTIESRGWQPIQSVYSTHYTVQDGLHAQKKEWLGGTLVELQDVMCGSLVVLQTAQFYAPAYDMTDGVELIWNYNGQIFVFSLPQNPTGDITITLIEND
jgi:arabinogalactan endo-1,4-beta-galactosidase